MIPGSVPCAIDASDGVTGSLYAKDLVKNLGDLHERLRTGTYRAQPVQRVYIPKTSGGDRPIARGAGPMKGVGSALLHGVRAPLARWRLALTLWLARLRPIDCDLLGESKVGKLGQLCLRHHHVRRLDIAMNHAQIVRTCQC